MEIGDLVDDGFGNLGFIVDLGWLFPERNSGGIRKERAYLVHFPATPNCNGWYDIYDLKKIKTDKN